MRAGLQFLLVAGLGLLATPALFGAGAEEPPISMPQMVVIDSRFDPHPWLYAKAPGIEVLSKLSEEDSLAYAEGFRKAEQMLASIVPPALWGRSKKPVILVICPGSTTTANAETMQQIDLDQLRELKDEHASPIDAFSGALRFLRARYNPNNAQQLVSYYDRETTVFFNRRMNFRQSTVYYAAGNQGADVLLGRSLYRTLAEQRAPAMPAWLVEGLPVVLAESHLDVDQGHWGIDPLLAWPMGMGSYKVPLKLETRPRLLPLEQLFGEKPPHDSPDYSWWSYECVLFVRWAFGRAALWNFVAGVGEHGASEALFQKCFGLSYLAAENRMCEKFEVLMRPINLEVRVTDPVPPLNFREADPLEVRRIVAELGRLQSEYLRLRYPQLAVNYLNSALTTLAKPKFGVEQDPEYMAVWGLCALAAGDTASARRCLEAMNAGAGVPRPRAYFALAQLRYAEAVQQSTSSGHQLDAAHVEAVLNPLLKAISLPPPMADEFRLLLDLCEHGDVTLAGNSRAALEGATKLFPADMDLAQRIGKVLSKPSVGSPP